MGTIQSDSFFFKRYFYFAGHGMQVNGNNYLIPVDADIESASDIKYEAVDVGRVQGKMEDTGNGLNIIVLDACRDNPFSRSYRPGRRGLAHMDAPKGTFMAYATAPGAVAADGEGSNGLLLRRTPAQEKARTPTFSPPGGLLTNQ